MFLNEGKLLVVYKADWLIYIVMLRKHHNSKSCVVIGNVTTT